ncbi:MAG: site-specific DNA-methyltransferase, partial [Desulfovibrio sp.]|nr:site-specific DNA-methyltransferase [Desulfovibrio sp.]
MNRQNSANLGLEELLKKHLPALPLTARELQNILPSLAKDRKATHAIEEAIQEISTFHKLFLKDARQMDKFPDESVHLVVTSPPYWTLKEYPRIEGQLGKIGDYEQFLDQLEFVWRHCYRLLTPGGRLVIVVGDVCLSRRRHGRHAVIPLHASIQERCRKIGFDNLAPIIWYKIANAALEVKNGSSFLGKPYEPNAIIKNDVEYILMQRKPGAYRSPTPAMRVLSLISEENHRNWFQQVWQLP